jgi:hypothetical protein
MIIGINLSSLTGTTKLVLGLFPISLAHLPGVCIGVGPADGTTKPPIGKSLTETLTAVTYD